MRYNDFFITEALKPSEYRDLVKGWDKRRYADIFKNPKYKHDRNGYRVYIPIESGSSQIRDNEKSNTYYAIEKFLKNNGYEIVDYIKGIARNIEKNQEIKIGKVLAKLKPTEQVMATTDKGVTKNLPLLDAFNVDKIRKGNRSDYMVVISRHPYDIAGMSTDRGWSSCMNLKNGINSRYVPIDINEGTVIAYVTTINDINLKNPTGRVLLKPFIDVLGKPQIYFGIENVVYGTRVPGFIETVEKWVDEINKNHELDEIAILKFNPKLYNDSGLANQTYISKKNLSNDDKKNLQDISNDPRTILTIENPTDDELIVALSSGSSRNTLFRNMFETFDNFNPSERVQIAAVNRYFQNIYIILDNIKNISDDVLITALKNYPKTYKIFIDKNIKIPQNAINIILEFYPSAITDLVYHNYKLSNENLITAVRSDGYMLEYIFNQKLPVNDTIIETAINHGYKIIDKIAYYYMRNGEKVPKNIIKSFIKHHYYEIDKIFQWNKDYPEYSISIDRKNLVNSIIEDFTNSSYGKLCKNLIEIYDVNFNIDEVVKIVKETKNIRILSFLEEKNKLDPRLPDAVLDYMGYAIKYIENPTNEQQMRAVKSRPTSIEYIKNPKEEVVNYAVKKNPVSLLYVEKPTVKQLLLAAKHKMPDVQWRHGESDNLDLAMFFDAVERAEIDDKTREKLENILVKVEPYRFEHMVKYGGIFPNKKMQIIAAEAGIDVLRILASIDIKPDRDAVIIEIEKSNFSDVIRRISYYNMNNNKDPFILDEELIMLGLKKDKKNIYSSMLELIGKPYTEITDNIINYAIDVAPSVLLILNRNEKHFNISKTKLIDAIKNGAIDSARDIKKYYEVLISYGVDIDTDIMKYTIDSIIQNEGNGYVIAFMNIETFCEKNNIPISEDFLKYLIDIDKRMIGLMGDFDKETRQKINIYAWKKHKYWQPLSYGDMVRVTNPNAKPTYKITKVNDDSYIVEKDGKTVSIPRERILRLNNALPPSE